MKEQPAAHIQHRTIYKANRSNSVTPNPTTSSAASLTSHYPASSSSPPTALLSVLGKRSSGRLSPFVFLDGEQPLDYTDFTQIKLPLHTLLYLCADQQYSNKHTSLSADDEPDQHDDRHHNSSTSSRMEVTDNGKDEKADQLTSPPPQPHSSDSTVRYDAITATADNNDGQQPSQLFSHHPFHRFYRSYKAALAAWNQRQSADRDGTVVTTSGRVMEFACREALHVLEVTVQQREAVFASASASSSLSSAQSVSSYLPSPPALLTHLLTAHNGCVGYEVEGEEADGIVLTSSACECQLSLLDDDKRAHVSQALLTDMFARLHC